MTPWTFTIPGCPIIQQRPRKGRGNWFYDPTAKEKKSLALWLLAARQMHHKKMALGFVSLKLTFYLPGRKRADADNLQKALFDAGNGVLWKDDNQIVEVSVRKVWEAECPRTEVSIEEI